MSDLIDRKEAIGVFSFDKEMLNRLLDDMDVVGTDREKYSWGLGLIESYINDIWELPSADPKNGRWTDEGWYADGFDHHVYCCPKCGKHYIKCPDEIIKFKYCPNCGVK